MWVMLRVLWRTPKRWRGTSRVSAIREYTLADIAKV
jgi:hypothetical protein